MKSKKNYFPGLRYFHSSRYLRADPANTTLILACFGVSPPFFLAILLTSYVLGTGVFIYSLVETSQIQAQYALMFPDEGPGNMFFIPDHIVGNILVFIHNIDNAIHFWNNPNHLQYLSSNELMIFLERVDLSIRHINSIHDQIIYMLDLNDPMYNISYEMIQNIHEQLLRLIRDMSELRAFIITILANV